MLRNKTILITGATGSLGNKLTEIILTRKPRKLIALCHSELRRVEMGRLFTDNRIRYLMGDIRDRNRLFDAFKGVDYIFHCAALKHVDVCERDPKEAIKTNIGGAENIIDAAIERGVKKVLAVSTDKAINPINAYGAVKLCADKLFVHANVYDPKGTRFAVVRFGNFIGSSGSVIPYFQELKRRGLSIPITDEQMTRFFISLDDAANFCLKSLGRMKGGEICVPKMPAVKIVDLAKQIYPDGKIEVVGIRDGEKLHEDLVSPDDGHKTYDKGGYFVTYPFPINYKMGLVHTGFTYNSKDCASWGNLSTLQVKDMVGL